MRTNRSFIIAMASAVVVISVTGAMRWHRVEVAQNALNAEISATYGPLFTFLGSVATSPPSALQVPQVDLSKVRAHQLDVSVTQTDMGMLNTLAIFAGCLAVTYYSRAVWPAIVVAAYGWLVNGVANAAATSRAFGFIATMTKTFGAAAGTSLRLPTPGHLPFPVYVILGLFSAWLWQGVVPGLAGGFLGWKAAAWRAGALDLGPPRNFASSAGHAAPDSGRCACGAVNLPGATSCYACGVELGDAGGAR